LAFLSFLYPSPFSCALPLKTCRKLSTATQIRLPLPDPLW
jgi:hypothetical protein